MKFKNSLINRNKFCSNTNNYFSRTIINAYHVKIVSIKIFVCYFIVRQYDIILSIIFLILLNCLSKFYQVAVIPVNAPILINIP